MSEEKKHITAETESTQTSESVWLQIKEDTINMLGLNDLLNYPKVISQVTFVLFMVSIFIFHIYNSHKAVRLVRERELLKKEIKELKWEHISIKSDMLQKSMLSDIEIHADSLGLKSLQTPPYKIVVSKHEN